MDQIEALKNRIYKLKEDVDEYNHILLPFYNLEQQSLLSSCFKKNDRERVSFYGGYSNSEYKRAIISQKDVDIRDFEISTIKIISKEDKLTHRSILGSILGLGLKREVIGDIITKDNDYYFFVSSHLKDYVLDNLNKVGRTFIYLEEYKGEIDYQIEYKENTIFVSSMRLDNIVSSSLNISRNKVKDMIIDGLIKINHKVITSPDKVVKIDDLLSIKGYGRILISDNIGKTKSGNLIIKIKMPK